MKKFISMVMAAAMVVSLVPATAFAANTATFKVLDDIEWTEDTAKTSKNDISGPEIQLKVKDVDTKVGVVDEFEITLDFDNIEVGKDWSDDTVWAGAKVLRTENGKQTEQEDFTFTADAAEEEDTTVTLTLKEPKGNDLEEDDIIVIPMLANGYLRLTKTSKGTEGTVEVGGDFGDSDALVVVAVLDCGLDVTLKKVAEVAEEEETELEKELKIESTVENFVNGQIITIKVSNGFEFSKIPAGWKYTDSSDKDEITYTCDGTEGDTITIAKNALKIDAADAKVGDVAKLTVKAKEGKVDNKNVGFKYTATAVEAAKVVADTVTVSVDEDEDVPVIYSGVNVDNYGITDDSDHMSLEVTVEEATKGSLDVKKSFTMTLPEGVYVTGIETGTTDGVKVVDDRTVEEVFKDAYEKGEQECFEFARKTFVATDDASVDKALEFEFKLQLIAEPGFEGDVVLTLGGDAFDGEQEVTIAKFVAPYTVEAQQNDLIIDYRNTEVPTNVVVKEAEAGLWAKGEMTFEFDIEKMEFEDDATFTVNEDDSDMEIKVLANKDMAFKVTEESDDEAGVVTISDISLYMGRSLAAGAYDLELITSAGEKMMTEEPLFTNDTVSEHDNYYAADFRDWDCDNNDFTVEADTVKEGFVNVITAGRDQDDASFTKKVVVPVGESYIIAGEETVTLDVPAYVSASGYTMLPVRAVAVALGINNNSVLWDQATKTVTILYGQRIITMVAGQKVVYVNGSAIPASASVEIVNGRTFLPMRDLATALGVTDITWDAATKTATLNGNK